jgi:hypothetical protein
MGGGDEALVFKPFQKDRVDLGGIKPVRTENRVFETAEIVDVDLRIEDKIEENVRMRRLITQRQPPNERGKSDLRICRD